MFEQTDSIKTKGKTALCYFREPVNASPAKTRRCGENHGEVNICLFCGVNDGYLMSVSFTECDLGVRAWATDLEDFVMLTRGDLFAQDLVYHKECMKKYYTRHRSCLRNKHTEGKVTLEGIALAETVAYVIEDDNDGSYYIIELADLYTARLGELGGVVPGRIHTTHFKEHILSQIPWMSGQKADRKLYIACESAIGKAATRELNQTPDENACNMARTAIHLREQIFDKGLTVNLQTMCRRSQFLQFCYPL